MKTSAYTLGLVGWLAFAGVSGTSSGRDSDAAFTPVAGSAVRKEICDVMRVHVRKTTGVPAKRHFLFKVEGMRVKGNFCAFQGFPVNPDSSFAEDLPDVEFVTFLRKGSRGWEVISDLSRTDVPGTEELEEIRRTFPREIPVEIIPQFWRRMLNR